MIQISMLEESDMKAAVDKVLREHGAMPGTVLVVYCLRELDVKPEDFDRWEEQLRTYVSKRLFEWSDIVLTLPA